MRVISLSMLVNRRSIIFVLSALILAFLVNQAINVAQETMYLSERAREIGQAEPILAMAILSENETKAESPEPRRAPGEVYGAEEEQLPEGREPSIILNTALSLIAAAAVFLLVKHIKFKSLIAS